MAFHATGNLGDSIQTFALSRLIGRCRAWFRDQAKIEESPYEDLGIAAGFLLGPQGYLPEETLFAGVWYPAYDRRFAPWIARSKYPIGARDPATYRDLQAAKIDSCLVGCATLTLPYYHGRRSGELSVDYDGPGIHLTHKIPTNLTPIEEWTIIRERLDLYGQASLVHTTRIHVAMPCIAMGTPVRYVGPEEGRTSILQAIGIVPGKECCPDVLPWKKRYISFLKKNGVTVNEGDPTFPEIA